MKVSDLVRDTVGIIGAWLVAIGAGMVYLPAGLIVGGGMLLAGAWLSARRA